MPGKPLRMIRRLDRIRRSIVLASERFLDQMPRQYREEPDKTPRCKAWRKAGGSFADVEDALDELIELLCEHAQLPKRYPTEAEAAKTVLKQFMVEERIKEGMSFRDARKYSAELAKR